MHEHIRKTISKNLIPILVLFVLATRILPLMRGGITNLETLDTMLVVKQFAQGNASIFFDESWLQVYFITIPYSILRGFLSIEQAMHAVKAAFVLFSALIVYLLGKELGGQKAGYLSMLFFAISPLAIYTQSLGLWTGDAITPIFLAASILFLLYAKASRSARKLILWGLLSVMSLTMAYLSWNGGIYAVVAYLFVVLLFLLGRFTSSHSKTFFAGIALLGLSFLAYILSPYNMGIFSGGNYAGGILHTIAQFFSNNNFSLYGTGDVRNPIDFNPNPAYDILLPIGFLTSTFLIAVCANSFLRQKEKGQAQSAFIAVAFIYLISAVIALSDRRFDSLAIIPIAVLSGSGLHVLLKAHDSKPKAYRYTKLAFSILMVLVLLGSVVQIIVAQYPVDLTGDYISSMKWLSINTPKNSTFLTNIFDEAPIIYYGDRQSAIDGWNGGLWGRFPSNSIREFNNFLFSSQCNSTYLNSTGANYLIVDKFWLYRGFISNKSANGTNMKHLILDNNFHINCGGLNLLLIYESGYNLTRIYSIQKPSPPANNASRLAAFISAGQAKAIIPSNFTLIGTPAFQILNNNSYGEISFANEEFMYLNDTAKLTVSYGLFNNFSDASNLYLSTVAALNKSQGITGAKIGQLFNTTYVYINTSRNRSSGTVESSVISAVYGNYLVHIESIGSQFNVYQARQLLYNQIADINLLSSQ